MKNPGESLVIDFLQVGNSATSSWWLEYTDRDYGSLAIHGPGNYDCRFSNGRSQNGLSYDPPEVGGSWWLAYNGLLPNAPAFKNPCFL